MGKLFSVSFLVYFLLYAYTSHAQVNLGLKAGVTSFDFQGDKIFVKGNSVLDNFELTYKEATYGLYGAAFLNIKMGAFLLFPEIGVTSMGVNYSIDSLSSSVFKEKYTNLDVPLLAGFDLGVIQLKGGPVGHWHLNSSSELFDISTYSQNFENFQWGWQAGLGIKLWKVLLEVRYEKNNANFGNHIQFENESYSFDKKSTRYIATLGFLF